jgi:hypothetical protein
VIGQRGNPRGRRLTLEELLLNEPEIVAWLDEVEEGVDQD